MQYFVRKDSIVREIWGKSDTILLVFAGCAAEFALNKAVDWLYFTDKLPSDPLGRLFSTVKYAKMIVFAPLNEANKALENMNKIHTAVEQKRGYNIPDWAYRDVLFMLIYYSIAAFELLERKLSHAEKEEVYNVFYRVGSGMGLQKLPPDYQKWLPEREKHIHHDLQMSNYTKDLFKQYRKHLGHVRFWLMIEAQKILLPEQVRKKLELNRFSLLIPVIPAFKFIKLLKLDWVLKSFLLPTEYKTQLDALDIKPA